MQPLLHSPLLQALGYAIINSLWQFALLWLLYFSINTVFKLSTHQRYITGLVLEFAGFTWFLETFHFYYNQSVLLFQHGILNHQVYFPGLLESGNGTGKQQIFLLILRFEQFFPFLSIAYLSLLLVLVARWLYAYKYTQQVRTEGLKDVEIHWHLFVQKLSSQLRIKQKVDIFLSEKVKTPLTIGFFKPLILVPVATVNYLTTQQLEAVILHELAHIKRFDYLFNLLLAAIEAVLFFNPFMQLIHQQVKKERENCCDDWVIKYDYNPASYAGALLKIAAQQTHSPLLALKVTGDKQLLINRIKRMIEKNEHTFFNYKHQLLALTVMTTVLSSLSFLTPSPSKKAPSNVGVQSNIVFEPMAANVNNPLFNPVFFLVNSNKTTKEFKKKIGNPKTVNTSIRLSYLPSPPPKLLISSVPGPVSGQMEFEPVHRNSYALIKAAVDSMVIANRLVTVTITREKATGIRQLAPASAKRVEARARPDEVWERQIRQHEMQALNDKGVILENVKSQLKNTLNQIKSIRTRREYNKLQLLVAKEMTKEPNTCSDPLTPAHIFKAEELDLLEKQMTAAFNSLNSVRYFSVNLHSDMNLNCEFPAVVYNWQEKQHSFSYEYSAAPKIRIINPPSPGEPKRIRKSKEKAEAIAQDQIDQDEPVKPVAPAKAPSPARFRTAYVIKI